MMKQVLALMLVIAWVGASTTVATEQTWSGTISDSQCGTNHGGEIDDRSCTLRCIQLGHQYVFVIDKNVLKIANQTFATLQQHAGRLVKLTGEQKGGAIVVSKIEMAAAKSK